MSNNTELLSKKQLGNPQHYLENIFWTDEIGADQYGGGSTMI